MACFKVCLTTAPCAVWLSVSNFLQLFLRSCRSTVAGCVISMTNNTAHRGFQKLFPALIRHLPSLYSSNYVGDESVCKQAINRNWKKMYQFTEPLSGYNKKKMEGFNKYWHSLRPPTTVQHDNAICIKDSLSSLVIGEGEQTFLQLSLSLPACSPLHNTWSAVIIHCWPISWQVCNGM